MLLVLFKHKVNIFACHQQKNNNKISAIEKNTLLLHRN